VGVALHKKYALYIWYALLVIRRLVILLQRRKKYKSRTILGYKTLAEGIIRMDAVLQKSMDMIIELTASGKNGRPGTVVACLRAERVSSIPVDHDNKNNNSVLLAGEFDKILWMFKYRRKLNSDEQIF